MNNRFSFGATCATLILISGCSLMHRKLDCIAGSEHPREKSYEGRSFELVIHSPSKELFGEYGRGKLNYKGRLSGEPYSIDARMSVDLFRPGGLYEHMKDEAKGDEFYYVTSELDQSGRMMLVCKEK